MSKVDTPTVVRLLREYAQRTAPRGGNPYRSKAYARAADSLTSPLRGARFPLAMAQRLDVLIDLPGNGPYPIIAHVEGKRARTGIVLAASGAAVSRLAAEAGENAPPVDLSLEHRL